MCDRSDVVASLFVELSEIELPELLGVAEHVDLDDLPADNGKADHGKRLAGFVERHDASRSIDERRARGVRQPGEQL